MPRARKRKNKATISDSSPVAIEAPKSELAELAQNYVAKAHEYARDVVERRIAACWQVRAACQRFLDDLERQKDASFPFVFEAGAAGRPCVFLEALPHVKGKWARTHETLQLEPWQCFIVCNAFGWVLRADPTRYRFRRAVIIVPRKNGKSFLGAGIALFKFCADNEYSPEVYFGATSLEQSKRLGFKVARAMVLASPELQEVFGLTANVNSITRADGGVMMPVIAKPGDGDSPSCAVIDEYHEHPTSDLVDTMETGMGARENPLSLIISTAGSNRGGPCFLLQKDIEAILRGTMRDDRTFGIVYTVDAEDRPFSEEALTKANPNCGVSVDRQFLIDEMNAARQSSRKQNAFKTKYLDIWVNASVSWMNMERWRELAETELRIEDYVGQRCLIALDLASEIDIASKVYLFPETRDSKMHFVVFTKHYLNERAIEDGRGEHYAAWVEDGWLTATPGNVTDYVQITDELVEDQQRYKVLEVPHDPYHAAALVQFAQQDRRWNQSVEFVKVTQSVEHMSPAMKQLEALVADGRLHHDGDPVLEWMIANVVARQLGKGNLMPDKESVDRKIDGAVALMMAVYRATCIKLNRPAGRIFFV